MIQTKPADIHTAFNNIIFKFSKDLKKDVTNKIEVTGVVNGSLVDSVIYEREYFNDVATFDIKGTIKRFFKNVKFYIDNTDMKAFYDFNLMATYTVRYYFYKPYTEERKTDKGFPMLDPIPILQSQELKFCALNAVVQAGQSSNLMSQKGTFLTDFDRLKFYFGYPLQVCVLAFDDTNSFDNGDGVTRTFEVNANDNKRVYCFLCYGTYAKISNAEDTRRTLTDNAGNRIVDNDGNIIYYSVGEHEERTKIIEQCCLPDSPFYIRWINTKGGWDSFMFSLKQYKTKEVSDTTIYEPYVEDIQEPKSEVKELTLPITAKGKETIIAGAENLSDNEYEVLSNIVFSPNIQYYDRVENVWHRIILKDTSTEKDTSENRNSIELTFIKNKRIMQY